MLQFTKCLGLVGNFLPCLVVSLHMRTLFLITALAGVLSAADSKEIRRTVPLDPEGRVVLETYKGTIYVSTWDRDEVVVDVRIEEDRSGWFFGAQPVSRSDVKIDASRAEVRLESKSDIVPTILSGAVPFFRYTIRMPRRASLRIKDYKSEADIDGLGGDLDLNTYKGTVRVRDLSGRLRLNTYKGTVRADFSDFKNNSSIETFKGSIELGLPRESRFDLRNDLGRRAGLDSDFPYRRDGPVNGGGPDLRLKSHKGRFRLVAR